MRKTVLFLSVAFLLSLVPAVIAQNSLPSGVANGEPSILASTLLGGSGEEGFHSVCVAVDGDGYVYVAGITESTNFPTTEGSFDASHNGDRDFFVSKLDPTLETLVASTYVGGSGRDGSLSMVLGDNGVIYLAGVTDSRDFPTTPNAYDASGGYGGDFVVFVLDTELTTLQASTYLGSTGRETAARSFLALDSDGNVYVTGYTESSGYPTTPGSYDTSYNGGGDSVVSKLDSSLGELLSSTYVGSSGNDWGYSLTIHESRVYFTGHTDSESYPVTPGAFDDSINGGTDAFLTALSLDLASLEASTVLGGSGFDNANSILVNDEGEVLIGGHTGSRDLPTSTDAYAQSYSGGDRDMFVSIFNGGLTELLASTFLGGEASEINPHVIQDVGVLISGSTRSSNFPFTGDALDRSRGGPGDFCLSRLDPDLSTLVYSTYIGGSGNEMYGPVVVTEGVIVASGVTGSRDFPVTAGAYDESYNGGESDIFVMKMGTESSDSAPDQGDTASGGIPGPTPLAIALGVIAAYILLARVGSARVQLLDQWLARAQRMLIF
jgi:hypothetical protein